MAKSMRDNSGQVVCIPSKSRSGDKTILEFTKCFLLRSPEMCKNHIKHDFTFKLHLNLERFLFNNIHGYLKKRLKLFSGIGETLKTDKEISLYSAQTREKEPAHNLLLGSRKS